MTKKKHSERELFETYKKEAVKYLNDLDPMQRSFIEPSVWSLFNEYERRYLRGPVLTEDEDRVDMLGDIHRQAQAGEMPPPEELSDQINEFIAGQMNLSAMLDNNGARIFAQPRPSAAAQNQDLLNRVKFDYKPREIVTYLDKTIIGQRLAKETLARAVFYHYNAILQELKGHPIVGYQKNNVILIGPPGSGKTSLVSRVAELLNVPFMHFDATQFSPTGIVGKDASSIVREMVKNASENKQLAEYGIVFVDEFDKLVKGYAVSGMGASGDSFGKDIQATFLRILEDQEVDLLPEHSPLGMLGLGGRQEKIRTRYMLFIVAGAFDGLAEIVERRIGGVTIGFLSERRRDDPAERKRALLSHVSQSDLIEYGFLGQLSGRLPIIATVHELKPEHLFKILTQAEGNVLQQYCQQIKTATGTDVEFGEDALWELAQKAYALTTGARGLITVCENALKDLMFDLPQVPGIEHLYISREALQHPKQMIFGNYTHDFRQQHDVTLSFTDEAVEYLLRDMNQDPFAFLDQRLEPLPAALRLVNRQEFEIGSDFLKNPTEYLKNFVQEHQPAGR